MNIIWALNIISIVHSSLSHFETIWCWCNRQVSGKSEESSKITINAHTTSCQLHQLPISTASTLASYERSSHSVKTWWFVIISPVITVSRERGECHFSSWNNGKSGAKLDLTSSTKPGLQIHKFDHTRTANPCDWLPCRCAALPLVGCPSATSPSCWGTHFLYLSNPPSLSFLPILLWTRPRASASFDPLTLLIKHFLLISTPANLQVQ